MARGPSGSYGDRKLPRNAELLYQGCERLAEIFQSGILRSAFTVRAQPRTELSMGAPYAVFVLFDGDRHGYGPRLGHALNDSPRP